MPGLKAVTRGLKPARISALPLAGREAEEYPCSWELPLLGAEDHRMDVVAWLRGLGLERYEAAFRDNDVDGEVLPELTSDDLISIGVTSVGHRRKLLAAIASLRAEMPAATVTTASRDSPEPAAAAATAERRQLTVMFCDLVGSTALSARLDPEDLREVIGAYHRAVAEVVAGFDGFLAKYMGDGVLVYFGYPQAHEDDAERAVRAGLGLIDAVGRLEVKSAELQARVGIGTGLVVVGDLIGSGESQERGVVGDTPNLAARLQGLAEPNTVLTDGGTRRLLGNLFEYRDLDAVEIKGFPDPVKVWQVLRPSTVESRFEALRTVRLTPLVGRDDEIELLMRRWLRAKEGEGQIVLLAGEPGLGKSRMAAAISERLGSEPHRRLRYFCSPQHRESPLYPFITHLERAAGFTREDPPELKLEKLDALLARSGESSAETAALFADLLGLAAESRYPPPPDDPQRRRELTFAAMLDQFGRLARRGPVLLILEDGHWIDSTSLELVEMMIEQVPRLPVLFVLTFRPEFTPPWTGAPHVTSLMMSRLNSRETAALAEQTAAGKALPPEILDQIVQRADGIPLFIEELTKTILESCLIREEDGQYRLDGPLPSVAIPSSLQASLMARLDRLSPIKEVAQIGSAIGREFSYQLMAAVAPHKNAELEAALGQLVDSGLVFCRGEPPHGSFIFKHALVQDAAYSTLLRSQRQELHFRIGKALEERFPETAETQPEILAHHYALGGVLDQAIGYWRKAGERALRRSATTEAVQHLTHAIELTRSLPTAPDRDRRELDLHLALGRMIRMVKGMAAPDTLHVFSRAHELLDEDASVEEHITVLYGLWGVHYARAEHAAAHAVSQECLTLAERHRNDEAAALGHYILGDTLWATGAFSEARSHLDHILKLYGSFDESGAAGRFQHNYDVNALAFLAWSLWPLGYPAQASRAATQTIRRARQVGHVPLMAFALHCGALLETGFGDDDEPDSGIADEAVAFSVQHGVAAYELWARFWQGAAIARRGDPHQGADVMRASMEAAATIEAKLFRPLHLGQLANAYARLDQPETAIGLLDEALATSEETKERLFDAELHRRRGDLFLILGNASQAETTLEEALTVARAQNARLWELRAATSLARLWRKQRRHVEARDLLEPVYGWFTEGFDTADLRRARALLNGLQ
jgi:class 3 adenylate cyclase/predicted ATPase